MGYRVWNRAEPDNVDSLSADPEVLVIFLRAGWLDFFRRFQGHDPQLTLEFEKNI
jgi:hypothetical protein